MSPKILICRLLLLRVLMICLALSLSACGVAHKHEGRSSLDYPEQPIWVTELEHKQDILETVGYSSEMELPELSLKRSDNRAIAEMANILASTVRSSVSDALRADNALSDGTIEVIYTEITELYANANISGVTIVDHYKDPKIGLIYSLARLKREYAVRDASMKADVVIRGNEALFDRVILDDAIRSRLIYTESKFMEATGQASIPTHQSEEQGFGSYELAMRRAELNARAILARRVGVKVTNDVQEWLSARRDSLAGSSTELAFEDIASVFTEVNLDGARIMRRYFDRDTRTAYAQAVMPREQIVKEFSRAVVPVLNKTGLTELEGELDQIIKNSLDILLEDEVPEELPDEPVHQESEDSSSLPELDHSSSGWEWWNIAEKEGVNGNCFYGVGSGNSQRDSDREALERLSRYIGVHVTTKLSEELKATGSEVQLWYEESINVESNMDLYGVTYINRSIGSSYYSLAQVPRQRVSSALEAVARYHVASEVLEDGNPLAGLKQAMQAIRHLDSLDREGFPIYIKPNRLLKPDLYSLMNEALDEIRIDNITEVSQSGTEQFGVQIYTANGQNLRNEKVVFRFVDAVGEIKAIHGYTDANGRYSIPWPDMEHGSTLEAIPQFILDIENHESRLDLDSATGRFHRHWERQKDRLARDTDEIENLWFRIQEKIGPEAINGEKLRVKIWMDHEGSVYKAGEEIEARLRANRDCYLVLCNIPVDGQVRLIFPNEYQTDNYIKGGEVLQVPDAESGHPFKFYINPPYGKERLYAFASTWPLDDFIQTIRGDKQIGSVRDMIQALELNSSKSIDMAKGIGVKPLEAIPNSDASPKFAHDWSIFTSVPE